MNSMPNPEQTDPHDAAVAALKQAREQIGRADKQLPRADEQVSRLEQGAARHPSGRQKRLAVPNHRSSRGRLALLGLIGLLLAACIFAAAFVSHSSYGEAAKLIAARWAPQLISTSSLPAEKPGPPAQPSPSAVPVTAAEPVSPQPTTSAQTIAQDVAPTAAPPSTASAARWAIRTGCATP
jgi:hypothetical protein